MASTDFGADLDTHTQHLLFGASRAASYEEADLVYGWTALYSSFGSTYMVLYHTINTPIAPER